MSRFSRPIMSRTRSFPAAAASSTIAFNLPNGESFSAAHIVGYFDDIESMHKVYAANKGYKALTADKSGWKLVK